MTSKLLIILLLITISNATTDSILASCGPTNSAIYKIEVLKNGYARYDIIQEINFTSSFEYEGISYQEEPNSIITNFTFPAFVQVLADKVKCFDDRGEQQLYQVRIIDNIIEKDTRKITIECNFNRYPLDGSEERRIV